ncbi:MAG: hypothetical protein U0457_17745 [Candidatus Sericytochromatia bacterium]
MFKILSSLVTTKASEINNFSNAFKEMNKSKELIDSLNTKDDDYKKLFEQGIFFLNKFSDNDGSQDDVELLHQSAINFTKAIEIKKSKADSYFYMSYIFYMMKEFDLALNYIKVVSSINDKFSGLDILKKQIFEAQNDLYQKALEERIEKDKTTVITKKPTVVSLTGKKILNNSNNKLKFA